MTTVVIILLFLCMDTLYAQSVFSPRNAVKVAQPMCRLVLGESSPSMDLFQARRDERGASPLIKRSVKCCEGSPADV